MSIYNIQLINTKLTCCMGAPYFFICNVRCKIYCTDPKVQLQH